MNYFLITSPAKQIGMKTNTTTEANEIKRILKEKGISIVEAANKMGLTRQALYARLDKDPLEGYFLRELEEKFGIYLPGRKQVDITMSLNDVIRDNKQTKAVLKTLMDEIALLRNELQGRDLSEVLNDLNQKARLNLINMTDRDLH